MRVPREEPHLTEDFKEVLKKHRYKYVGHFYQVGTTNFGTYSSSGCPLLTLPNSEFMFAEDLDKYVTNHIEQMMRKILDE